MRKNKKLKGKQDQQEEESIFFDGYEDSIPFVVLDGTDEFGDALEADISFE